MLHLFIKLILLLKKWLVTMTSIQLLKVLDEIDKNLRISVLSAKQLRLFFPNESKSVFSVGLNRQVKNGLLVKLCNGLYFNKRSRHIPPNFLEYVATKIRAKETFYLSLESVLSENGLISQIPNRLTFISSSRSQIFHTPYGIIEFVKTSKKEFFDKKNGVVYNENRGIFEASVERAIKDAYQHRRSIDLLEE